MGASCAWTRRAIRLQVEGALKLPELKRPAVPTVPGSHVAAFNLENFFNGDGQGGGFPTLRGARTLDEHKAQLAKLVTTVNALGADVAALMELENDGYGPQSAIAELVDARNRGRAGATGASSTPATAPATTRSGSASSIAATDCNRWASRPH